jgi:hypothetical protein
VLVINHHIIHPNKFTKEESNQQRNIIKNKNKKEKEKKPIEYGSSPLILKQTDKHPKIPNVLNFVMD